jgi:Fic family protein
VTLEAIRQLFEYPDKKQRELRATQLLITRSPAIREQLNSRQLGIVRHAMKHPRFTYTIESHKNSNNISYATARSDLLKLVKVGLLDQRKGPKRLTLFVSPPDLQQRIATVA